MSGRLQMYFRNQVMQVNNNNKSAKVDFNISKGQRQDILHILILLFIELGIIVDLGVAANQNQYHTATIVCSKCQQREVSS